MIALPSKRTSSQLLTRDMNRDEARRVLDAQAEQSQADAGKGRSIALLSKTWFACGSLDWTNTVVSPGVVTTALVWSSTMNGSGSSNAFTPGTPPAQISSYGGPLILPQLRSGSAAVNTYQCRPSLSGGVITLNLYDSAGVAVNGSTVTFHVVIDLFIFFPVASYTL